MIANIVLDYTSTAPPLSSAAVKTDLDYYETRTCRTPSKIIMWAHQWLWLVKKAGALAPDTWMPWEELPAGAVTTGANTLWGIPVEVRDPDALGGAAV